MFTAETAKLAGIKSGEARRAIPTKQFAPLHLVEENIRLLHGVIQDDARTVIEQQLSIIREQIAHARKDLNDAMNEGYHFCPECKRHGMVPGQKAQLMKALEVFLARECKLMMIAEPANVKVNSKPSHTQTQDIEPG